MDISGMLAEECQHQVQGIWCSDSLGTLAPTQPPTIVNAPPQPVDATESAKSANCFATVCTSSEQSLQSSLLRFLQGFIKGVLYYFSGVHWLWGCVDNGCVGGQGAQGILN